MTNFQHAKALVWCGGWALVALIVSTLWLALLPAWSLAAWEQLLGDGRWWRALALSAWIAAASTALSLALCYYSGQRLLVSARALSAKLPLLLALPHAALALGLLLLLMPTGWIGRALAALFGWQRPHDLVLVNDPWALSLIAALVLKEAPFLLWVLSNNWRAQQAWYQRQLRMGASLGYAPRQCWRWLLWPQLLPKLRWALLAVLAYALSSVEMALIIGPNTPPPLAVLSWHWLRDASSQASGSISVFMQVLALALSAALLWSYERWLRARSRPRRPSQPLAAGRAQPWPLQRLIYALYIAAVLALLLAACSGVWPFPQLLPTSWQLRYLAASLSSAAWLQSVVIASLASALALVLLIAWLESSRRASDRYAAALLFCLLIMPPLLLSSGLYQLSLRLGLHPGLNLVWLAHSIWILPYGWLVLNPAWRAYDQRYAHIATSLGQPYWRFLLLVKLPMLKAPLSACLAIGVAVSLALYLPTQFLGAGRVATLTTETINLAAGGQRNIAAAYAFWQALLPALAFYAAHRYSHRR